MTAGPPAARLDALTGLRFVAAAWVALHHFASLSGVYPANGAINAALGLGYVSVNFFFVLSGFVLAWNYIGVDGALRVSRREFWTARFARIYPAYLLALLLALPILGGLALRGEAPAAGAVPLDNLWALAATVITTPLLLQDWFGLLAWNAVGWSLSVEAFFYATFPFVAPRIGRWSRARLWVGGWICSGAAIALTTAVFWHKVVAGETASWYEVATFTEGFFYASPLIHWPEFLLGVIAARLFQQHPACSPPNGWRALAREYGFATCGAVCFVAFQSMPGPVFTALMSPVFAVLICLLAGSSSLLARGLGSSPMRLLGDASYGVYLFHATAIQAYLAAASSLGWQWALSWPAFLTWLTGVVGFAVVVFLRVEEPARRWIRSRWIDDLRTVQPPAPRRDRRHISPVRTHPAA